jgi:hypothetical protein
MSILFKFSIYLQLGYLFGLLCFAGAMIIQITTVEILNIKKWLRINS